LIKNEGKILTVSFHSLEDRLCKQFFKSQLPWQSHELSCFPDSNFISLSKKPIAPSSSEIRQNPRCRSGKLRGAIFQKTISDFDSNFNKKNRN
jgi:16S rRNA (cytosine1402-N4)-methyltransferase